MRTTTEIKQYFLDTFTGHIGINTVIVGGADEVNEAILNDLEYPVLWVMYPFQRRKIWLADMPRWKWSIEMLILKFAKFDEKEVIQQNFDDTQELGEAVISKMYIDSEASDNESFTFDPVDNVEEWQPKTQFGADNCNGWLIPFQIITT